MRISERFCNLSIVVVSVLEDIGGSSMGGKLREDYSYY